MERDIASAGKVATVSAPAQAEHKATAARPASVLALPTLVFGMVEVHRLQRELEALDEYFRQSEIREAGKQPPLPRVSRLLDACVEDNHLNLVMPEDRQRLTEFLRKIASTAPTIHVSFAADPSSAFTAKIVAWLRGNIHPQALLQLGLQPNIAAGCIVRTNNKVFDFSLRKHFDTRRDLLIDAISKADV